MKISNCRPLRGLKALFAIIIGVGAVAAMPSHLLAQAPESPAPEAPAQRSTAPDISAPDTSAPANSTQETQAPASPVTQAGGTPEPTASKDPVLAPKPALPIKIKQPFERLKADIASVEKAIERLKTSEKGLAGQRDKIDAIVTRAGDLRTELAPQLDEVGALIKKLGPPPGKGKPAESRSIAATRDQLNKQRTALDGVIKTTKLIETRAAQLLADIQAKRQALFTRDLLRRSPSPLASRQSDQVAKSLPGLVRQLGFMTSAWWQNAQLYWLQLLALLGVAAGAGYYLSTTSNQSIERITAHAPTRPPEFLDRIGIIAWVLPARLVPGIAVLSILLLGLAAMGLLAPPFGTIALALGKAVMLVVIVMSAARTLLAPVRPRWRLLNLASRTAKPLYWLIALIAVVFAIDLVFAELARALFAPLTVRIFETFMMSITLAGLLIGCALLPYGARERLAYGGAIEDADQPAPDGEDWSEPGNHIAMSDGRPMSASFDTDETGYTDETDTAETGTYSPRARWWLRFILLAFAALIIGLSLAGYIAFGGFLARQIVLTGTLLIAGILMHLAVRSFVHGHVHLLNQPDTPLPPNQRFIDRHKATLMHGVGLFLNVALIVSLAPWLLLQWGFDGTDIVAWMKRAVFGFDIGGFHVSLARIAMAFTLFFAFVFLTRALQRWLDRAVLQRPGVDLGIAHSVRTAVGYGGMTLAALLAISYAGFNITNLAIVAGALSVGIGFGLQSIVNNFVSGLILLAERPIKVGDWISLGNQEGYVRRISVRATEIETFDRASVIVPNSELIAGRVTNLTHRNALGRAVIKVGVGYGEDPERVRDLLLEVARASAGVLKFPAPSVSFDDFAASSLDFTLRAYVADVNNKLSVATALRFEIFKAFRDGNIEIPYQQHDIHLRDLDSAKQVISQVIAERNRKKNGE